MSITDHLDWFDRHVAVKMRVCEREPEPLEIKRAHTARVLENARQIAAEEGFEPVLRRATLLAALYHDLSRFDQYLNYGTFKDRDSRNHGSWSVKLLREHDRLAQESPEIRRLVYVGVGLHNRLVLPETLSPDQLIVANAVRDADKIDITRVMAGHLAIKPYNPTVVLGLPDCDLAGSGVLQAALADRPASYADLRSVNDFRLLLGTWLHGLNFAASRRMFICNGQAAALVSQLPDNEIYGEVRAKLLGQLAAS